MTAFPSRDAIISRQFGLLGEMLRVLARENRFYARKWADFGFSGDVANLDEFLRRAPFTLKSELIEDQLTTPPYGTNLTYPLERYSRFTQTSGTTGNPLRWLDTSESWGWMVENWLQVYGAAGVTAADRIFFAFSFGPFLGFWTAFDAGVRLGALCLPGGGMSSGARLQAILDNQVTALCCTPTYALRLGEAAVERGLDLTGSPLRVIIAAGEPGAAIPATRARIESAWPGARLRDHHGMTEVGPVTYECPVREGVLHVIEEAFIAEVVDPGTGMPQPPGASGELVLTNLGRWGSPLVRYRTGDLVKSAGETVCACGRSNLALEGGIIGRTDDLVFVRGVNVFPTAVEETVRRFDSVAEYRVEVRTTAALTELSLELEPAPGCADPDALARDVEAALRTSFNLRIPVSLAAPGALPRFELKSKRWVRVKSGEGCA